MSNTIPHKSHIYKIRLFYEHKEFLAVSFKFFDRKGLVILDCGDYSINLQQ
jgi:hypothetical protein